MKPRPHNDERQLLERIIQRDQTALAELYDCYAQILYSFVFKVLGVAEESEEVVLDVLTQVWTIADQYDPQRGKLDTWLFMLARSRALDRLRSKQRQSKAMYTSIQMERVASSSQRMTPDENAVIVERRDRLMAALQQLPQAQRTALELAYFQGLTYPEIAQATGTSLGTVKTRLRLGLNKLRGLFPLIERDNHG